MKSFSSNSRRKRIGAMCTLLLATQLTACGGGDDNDPAPVTPPPTGNTPPPPPPEPAKANLTLSGRVTDAPIANAVVTATVGDEIFTANADANGDYTLEIEIEETEVGAFVTLNARGVGDQAFVEFTSLAGSFQSLAAQAGDDDTLSNDENFSTQITNVSTAEAVLMIEANGGEPVVTDAALQSLSNGINAQDILDLSAAIKLTVDDAANYPMPEGQTSILALASDAAARRQFIDDVYEQDPAAFATTQAAIVQDAGLARPIDADEDLTFTAALLSSEPDFSFNYTGRVIHFDLYEGGSGNVQSETYDVPTTWTIEGSTIEVTYTEPVATASWDFETCTADVGYRQVRAEYVTQGATIAFISERTVAITTTSEVTYPDCASLEPRQDVSTVARTVLTMDSADVIDVEELHGEAQTFYVYDAAQQAVVADIADINADGTGTTRLTNQSFTWTVEEDGKIIAATFNDGATAEYLSLSDLDELSSDIYWEVRTAGDGPVYVGAGASVFLDPEYALELTAENVPGSIYQFGLGAEGVDDDRLKGFRMRFDVDGTGAQEDDYVDEEGNVVTTDETTDPFVEFHWTIEDGDIVIRRTVDVSTNPGTANCIYGAADCVLLDIRRIIPLGADEGRIYVLEHRAFDFDNGVSASTPTTSLIRFYDHEPLAGAATASSKSQPAPVANKARALLRGPQLR